MPSASSWDCPPQQPSNQAVVQHYALAVPWDSGLDNWSGNENCHGDVKGGGKGGDKGGDNGGGKGDAKGGGKGGYKGGDKGGGKGKGKGKVKAKQRVDGYEPQPSETLLFHTSQDHAFYDSFPTGNPVDIWWYNIDTNAPIVVEQVSSDWIETDHAYHGRRWHWFVAVSFISGSGYRAWTNFSRDGILWMRFP